jgi:hypothetical protein
MYFGQAQVGKSDDRFYFETLFSIVTGPSNFFEKKPLEMLPNYVFNDWELFLTKAAL